MSWIQITQPNLNQTSRPYYCAEFVFNAYGARNGWGFQWAHQAWGGQANKHVGELPPAGVAVPVWFDYFATLSGTYRNWGHVAIALPDGRVLSAPTNQDAAKGQTIFASVQDCERRLGCKYLGWTESMDGTTVVEYRADQPADIDALAHAVIRGEYGNGEDRKARLGANYDAVQARVNELLAAAPAPVDIDGLAHAVIRGEYGNGEDRKARLGANYDAVQARVNQILGY